MPKRETKISKTYILNEWEGNEKVHKRLLSLVIHEK